MPKERIKHTNDSAFELANLSSDKTMRKGNTFAVLPLRRNEASTLPYYFTTKHNLPKGTESRETAGVTILLQDRQVALPVFTRKLPKERIKHANDSAFELANLSSDKTMRKGNTLAVLPLRINEVST